MSSNKPSATSTEIAGGPRRSLLLSVLATASVVVVPTFFAFAVLVFSRPDPQILAAIGLAILLTAGAVVAGSAIWARQPESAGVSFGDLMLWSWIRQYQAEGTLHDATATMGFDRHGRFLGHSTASEQDQVAAMRAIAKALDAKSTYTLGHSARVARHARRVADELELTDEKTRALFLAAELHDLGNIALSDEVLRKAGKLTLEERSDIEAHVLVGARLVEKAGSKDVVDGILHHHERWDGDGYPEHLAGREVPAFARIIGIAEAYDAMTSTRPYRQSFSKQHAIEVLRAESGMQFDGELVEVFISTLRKPIALVERFPWLAAIQSQFRELFLVFKRIGAVAVSATASTIAIALILGSTVLSPGTPEDSVPELAERRPNNVEPIDRVLGERIEARDGAVTDIGGLVADGSDQAPPADDDVLGVRFQQEVRVASLEGDVRFDEAGDGIAPPPDGGVETPPEGGNNGGGGGNTPGGGGAPPDGGGTTPPQGGGNTPPPDGGGNTPPGGGGSGGENGGGNTDPKGGGDKNPDASGNGYSNENAPGHDEGGPGNSENAPGHNKGGSGRPEEGRPEEPGDSGTAPGQTRAAGDTEDPAPGNSDATPGAEKKSELP